jgi:hypothetical protein
MIGSATTAIGTTEQGNYLPGSNQLGSERTPRQARHQTDAHRRRVRCGSARAGWTTEHVLDEYDHLTAEDIQACLDCANEMLKAEASSDSRRIRFSLDDVSGGTKDVSITSSSTGAENAGSKSCASPTERASIHDPIAQISRAGHRRGKIGGLRLPSSLAHRRLEVAQLTVRRECRAGPACRCSTHAKHPSMG